MNEAERWRSPAAESGSGADAVGSQVQRFVRLHSRFRKLLRFFTDKENNQLSSLDLHDYA
jgi:hypothetical protein